MPRVHELVMLRRKKCDCKDDDAPKAWTRELWEAYAYGHWMKSVALMENNCTHPVIHPVQGIQIVFFAKRRFIDLTLHA